MSGTITEVFLNCSKTKKRAEAILFKANRKWQSLTWKSYYRQAEKFGAALLEQGIQRGDRVAIISDTRAEWSVADMGILGIGAITVPVYGSSSPEDMKYILENSQAKSLICENETQYNKWLEIRKTCLSVKHLIIIDGSSIDDASAWSEFLLSGEAYLESHPAVYKESCTANNLDDVATIIYTSGTTGAPKGVVLTHRQIMSEIRDVFARVSCSENDCFLSFLPYSHIFGRAEHWGNIYVGYTLAFAENIESLGKNLKEVKPTVFNGVPRIYEKIYSAVLNKVEAHPVKKKVFAWAVEVGAKVSLCQRQGKNLPVHLIPQYMLAKKLVFTPFLDNLGGNLRFVLSGGAPLSPQISEFFHAAGLLILEGYGLTETSAGITVNTPFEYKFGTVGKPFGDVEIKIAEDGEILVKSDKVMKEYYLNKAATDEVFIDGYFATGDIGKFDSDGFLSITDRKKDLIKTAGGKYIAPQKLENLMKLSPYISNVLIHGDRKKYIVAIITVDQEAVEKWAKAEGIAFKDFATLTQAHQIKQLVRDAVAEGNDQLASHETIKNFAILPKDFTIEGGELTPSMKVKRKKLDAEYFELLESLY